MDTSLSVPPPGHPLSSPAARAEPVGDLKRLDSRRVLARLLDGLVLLPLSIAAGVAQDETIYLPMLLLTMIYFFVAEATSAQTLGKRALRLRVMQRDGSAPTVNQISVRTVLRLIDDGPIGLIVMLLSGKRRQRIGDLLAGTTVGPADAPVPAPARSPLLAIYPAGWLLAAVVWFFAGGEARAQESYVASADAICARTAEAGLTTTDAAEWQVQLERQYAEHSALQAPESLRQLHAELLAIGRADLELGLRFMAAERRGDVAAFRRIERRALALKERRAAVADAGLTACA